MLSELYSVLTWFKIHWDKSIEEAKTLIQELTQERNTIIDEYNKLDKVATDKIKSLESYINSFKVKIETLTDEIARKDNELKEKDRLLEQRMKVLKVEIKE